MARFDVYQNPIAEQRRTVPYWLDIQSDFVESLQTRGRASPQAAHRR